MSNDVGLRPVEDADLELFFEQENDPEAVRRSRFVPREREAFMKHWTTEILGDPTVLVRTVTVDGEAAGHLVSWWEGERRYLGYWLGRRFWGGGVGSEMLRRFLELERTRPLYADPFAGNTASVRLLEKHGFQPIGTVQHGEDEHVVLVLVSRAGQGG